MSKFVNSVVLGLVSFVLILAVFWYVVEIRQESRVAITDVAVSWGTINSRSAEMKIDLVVKNPHRSQAELREIRYEIIVNGNELGKGLVNETLMIPPEQEARKSFVATVPTRFVIDWLDSHLENDERSRMQVKGEAQFVIATMQTVTPYEWESSWEGLYVDQVAAALHNCPSRGTEPCINSTATRWDTTGTQSVLRAAFELQNPNAYALRVKSWSVDLLLQNITVARGGAANAVSVLPNGQATVEVPVTFDRLALPGWWMEHIRRCETSSSAVLVKFVVEEDRMEPNGTGTQTVVTSVTWEFSAPEFETRFICET